jgi:hypothetical protein
MNRSTQTGPGVLGLAFVLAFFASARLAAEVRISEILYDPIQGGSFEFIELHNDGDDSVELEGWRFSDGIQLVFPAGSTIEAGGFLVVAADPEALLGAYEGLAAESVVGPYDGNLANGGERLALFDDSGIAVESLTWDDDSPWDFLPDLFGASLERLCYSSDAALPENWRAGHTPSADDDFGGSPGAANAVSICPPVFPERPAVKLSEIMYHAVLEESLSENHEFIEIHNAGDTEVSLAGWRFAGGIDFEFPAGATIGAGEFKVIAKNPERLAEVEGYGLERNSLLGPYERELDNGGEKVAIIGADGQGVESVSYDDGFPWPMGADALGAGVNWLDAAILPLEQHRYMGISLERVSYDSAAGLVESWAPSPLDGATPGQENVSAVEGPLPVVTDLLTLPRGATSRSQLIRADEEVIIQAQFSPQGPSGPPEGPGTGVRLEFFVEDIVRDGEEVTIVDMFDDGVGGGDAIPNDGIYTATLEGRPDNTIVRYRVLADHGDGPVRATPRESDPKDWHAYFVSPVVDTETRIYQLFIAPVPWGRLWSNVQGGRVSGCAPHPTWNARQFAIFVYEGKVYDCRVRYQGSRWNRRNGRNISRWTGLRPSSGPLMALSWRVSLPRYAGVDGRDELTLNKLTQSCPGYNSVVGYRLFGEVGLPSTRTRYIRFHINGNYYHYMIEYERSDENLIRRYNRENADWLPDGRSERVGHLHKSVGCNCDEGPYGWGDGRLLRASCGHSDLARYAATFPRKTHEWDSAVDFKNLIDELHRAWNNGRGTVEAQRAYFETYFDVGLVTDYIAIMNWQVPFDDMFQNHFWYQRISDGKWCLAPWDLDRNFGEWQGPNSSIFMGMRSDPSNRSGWWHVLKDSFLRAYREEYLDRLFELNNTLLRPENINRYVDEAAAMANPTEASRAPAGSACNFASRVGTFKAFARQRHATVNRLIAAVDVDAGPDQTVFAGATVQLDGSESTPEPSDEVPYVWSNGLTGAMPTAIFDEAGTYEIFLTVTVRNVEFSDSVVITVLPLPDQAFIERGGLVVMEAERFWTNARYESEDTYWGERSDLDGYSGSGYMEAVEETRDTFLTRYGGVSPELRYAIRFETPGEYRLWLHAYSSSTSADSVHVNLGGVVRGGRDAQEFVVDETQFLWSGNNRRDDPQLVTIPAPGLYFLSMWIRESAQIVDKLILTQDMEFTPEALGPPESDRERVGGGGEFIRADTDASGRVEISDAVATLLHLFSGETHVACADHADFDDSGRLDLNDAIGTLNFLFRRGPSPAAPFPEAGHDLTADAIECGNP